MKKFSLLVIVLYSFAVLGKSTDSSSTSKTLELSLGLGFPLALGKGLSGVPNTITPTSTATTSNASGLVTDARFLVFPFGGIVGVGMDFGLAAQGSPTYTSTDPALSKYSNYQTTCTSSNAVLALDLWENQKFHFSWWKGRGRLLGMYSVKANCALDFTAAGLSNYEDTANAKSYGGALQIMDVFFDTVQLGVEAGYRYYKSSSLIDPHAQSVVDSSNNPVKIDLSMPYLQVSVGLEF